MINNIIYDNFINFLDGNRRKGFERVRFVGLVKLWILENNIIRGLFVF